MIWLAIWIIVSYAISKWIVSGGTCFHYHLQDCKCDKKRAKKC